jgi:DNA polymerase III subunit beta
MKTEFIIQADTIRALLIHAPKNDVRHYLNGVCFDTDKGRAIALDRHRLLAVRLPEEAKSGQGSLIIPREALEAVTKGREDYPVLISIEGVGNGRATLSAGGMETSTPLIDGTFPDVDRVIPTKTSGEFAHINHEYLMDAIKAAVLLKAPGFSKAFSYCPVRHNGTSGALVDMGEDAVCAIMPMRSDAPAPNVPFTPPAI